MSHNLLPIGKNAIFVLQNEICATTVLVRRLQWFFWESSKSQ